MSQTVLDLSLLPMFNYSRDVSRKTKLIVSTSLLDQTLVAGAGTVGTDSLIKFCVCSLNKYCTSTDLILAVYNAVVCFMLVCY